MIYNSLWLILVVKNLFRSANSENQRYLEMMGNWVAALFRSANSENQRFSELTGIYVPLRSVLNRCHRHLAPLYQA